MRLRRSSYLLLILFFFISNACSYGKDPKDSSGEASQQRSIVLAWEAPKDFTRLRAVMVDSFTKAYEGTSLQSLGVNNLHLFLSKAFDEELIELNLPDSKTRWVTASQNGLVIGWASFDISNYPNEIYVRQLAIDPQAQKQGAGRKILFSILEEYPNTAKLVLVTRKVNTGALEFYKKLGFENSTFVHEGLDPNRYCGLMLEQISKNWPHKTH